MSEELLIQRCEGCGHRLFPERLACPKCGSAALRPEPAGPGRVLDRVDVLRAPSGTGEGPVHLSLVELDAGPRVLTRGPEELTAGDRVSLVEDGTGAVLAKRLPA